MRLNARWRRALVRLALSIPLAFAVVAAFAATGVINCVSEPDIPCYNNCAALLGGGPPPPAPTPTPDARIAAIQQLPLQGRAPSSDPNDVYTGGVSACDQSDYGVGCGNILWKWYGIVNEIPTPNYDDPQVEEGAVQEVDMRVVISDPEGTPAFWAPEDFQISMSDDVYAFDTKETTAFIDPSCPPPLEDSGYYSVAGCRMFTSPPAGIGPYGGISARFKPVVSGPPDYLEPWCAVYSTPGCQVDFNPSWHHRLF